MKLQHLLTLGLLIAFCTSCLGDRQTIIGQDLGDTSFVNKKFKGNLIDYKEGMSACDKMSATLLAEKYGVVEDAIIITDPTKSERYVNPKPGCMIHVKMSDQKFDHLTGTINVFREIKSNEYMADVAEATGSGENWEEAWALKKSMRKSSEWVLDMGQAAIWTAKLRKLEIKFEGYTLEIIAPGAPFNDIEKAKNRDYKSIAIAIAKSAGFVN
ncbi:hypothetical protein [Winogradskyella sp.]|uniref:hypothetical protein n=1 Tax=Winogradskyella sp. TaxID=1883156 RepID=UPI00260F6A4B|nr:hypothetical protein [Winogradskyella sp.]